MVARAPELDTFTGFFVQARAPRRRSLECFAEQEIVIPSGPFEGRRFSCDRQPYARHFFRSVDGGYWSKFLATGPSQSGKTLTCSTIPLVYHLFEQKETAIYGVPSLDIVKDKWREDLRPVIERTRYRDFLPRDGAGSRGGTPTAITFLNGATLRFMTGGGDDQTRAAFTSRILVVTEADGFDRTGETSRETNQLGQLEARTRAFGRRRRIYQECTVSTETGYTWATYAGSNSTGSRLALPCPHCGQHVTPEREHFRGWEDANDVLAAAQFGQLFCPACGEGWSEPQRHAANQASVLLHRGQQLLRNERGGYDLTGLPPPVDTLGFRWTAVNNLLISQADLAKDEWEASRELDSDNAELKLRQFVWTLPAVARQTELIQLNAHGLLHRYGDEKWIRGTVPQHAVCLTIGVDLGKKQGHWIVIAWFADGSGHVVDYGRFDIPYEDAGDAAILAALQTFKARCEAGWTWQSHPQPLIPMQVWIDSNYQGEEKTHPVFAFVRSAGPLSENRYRATRGCGETDGRHVRYDRPSKQSKQILGIGDQYHFTLEQSHGVLRTDVNADYWKTQVHIGLTMPIDKPGAITLFHGSSREHVELAKQLTAERKIEKEDLAHGRGFVQVWERVRKANHWFDATYLARAAAHHCGIETLLRDEPAAEPAPQEPTFRPLTMPDGRPFLVTER